MKSEPRTLRDYGVDEIDAARRVLVDLGQVLGSWFTESIVVVGGWVPDLLLLQTEEPHIGYAPADVTIEGPMISGTRNRVRLRVASIADFLVMKAHALAGRDKPKDAYDICFCLDHTPGGIESLAAMWRRRRSDPLVVAALAHLRDKFGAVTSYGPQQVANFYATTSPEERDRRSRRAFELVARFLASVG